MITVPQKVEELVRETPFLEELIARNLLNFSEYARQIRPQVEKELIKDVSIASIVMALKRLSKDIKSSGPITFSHDKGNYFHNITLKSDLVEFTYANSPTLMENLKKIVNKATEEIFFTWSRGVYETTIIVSKKFWNICEKYFSSEKLKYRNDNVSALTILLPDDNISEPGIYYAALKNLAWEGINILEVVSTYTELTLIIADQDIPKTIEVLRSGSGN